MKDTIIIIKGSIQQEYLTIVNIYTPNMGHKLYKATNNKISTFIIIQ